METGEGKENEKAEEIANDNDKEVIEQAVQIKQQEEAKKAQMAQKMMANQVNMSPDATKMMGGGMPGGAGGAIPQANALRGMAGG